MVSYLLDEKRLEQFVLRKRAKITKMTVKISTFNPFNYTSSNSEMLPARTNMDKYTEDTFCLRHTGINRNKWAVLTKIAH